MENNKLIIKNCPNFYKIIDFEFYEEDYISKRLVKIYKDFIFEINIENKNDLKMIKQMDFVVNKYIEDYYFRKEMQRHMANIKVKRTNNILKDIASAIINCFESYETGYTRNIYFARWI